MFLSTILDHSAARLTIKVGDVGGSFGLKSHPAREDVAVCAAAKLLHRPVKWVEDRNENLVTAGHARDERIHIEAAVARDGELVGLRARFELDSGAYPLLNIPLNLVAIIVRALLPGTLRLQHYSFEGCVVDDQQGELRRVPRTVGGRVLGPRAADGCDRPRARTSIRSRCAGATTCPTTRFRARC